MTCEDTVLEDLSIKYGGNGEGNVDMTYRPALLLTFGILIFLLATAECFFEETIKEKLCDENNPDVFKFSAKNEML